MASLEELLTWHAEIRSSERDYSNALVARDAVATHLEIANTTLQSSAVRRRVAWSRFLYLMGTALNDRMASSGSGAAPTMDKGKGKTPASQGDGVDEADVLQELEGGEMDIE